jgi:hypothetical protein
MADSCGFILEVGDTDKRKALRIQAGGKERRRTEGRKAMLTYGRKEIPLSCF